MRTAFSIIASFVTALLSFAVLFSLFGVPAITPRDGEQPRRWKFAVALPIAAASGAIGAAVAYQIGGRLDIVIPVLGSLLFLSSVAPLRPDKVPDVPRWWIFVLALSIALGVVLFAWAVGLPTRS